jgi:hypothetical protein
MTEREIEDRARIMLEDAGLETERLAPEGRRGWPDFCAYWDNHIVFVETKAPNGQTSAQQDDCHDDLRAAGMTVIVGDSADEICQSVCDLFIEWGVL